MINELKQEERQTFINLVYLAIICDEKIFDKEVEAFNAYAKKLNLDCSIDTIDEVDMEETLKEINTFKMRTKKIIFAELLGVLYSDDVYSDIEKEFVKKVGSELQFSEEEIVDIEEAVWEYIASYSNLMEVVNG